MVTRVMKNVSHFTFFNNTYPLPYSVFPEEAKQDLKSVEDIFHSLKCQLTAVIIPYSHAFSFPVFTPDSALGLQCYMLYFLGEGLKWLSYHYKQFLPLFIHATIKYLCTYYHGILLLPKEGL